MKIVPAIAYSHSSRILKKKQTSKIKRKDEAITELEHKIIQ